METTTIVPKTPVVQTWTNSEILQKAWDGIKSNLPFVAGLTLVYGFGAWVVNLIPFGGFILAAPLLAGYTRCLMKIREDAVCGYEDFLWVFLDFNRLIQLILVSVIVTVGSTLGLILLVVPGIWWMVASYLANSHFIIYGGDAIASVKKSLEIVKDNWWKYASFMGALFLVNLAGALCLIVGILISIPVSALAVIVLVESVNADARPSAHQ